MNILKLAVFVVAIAVIYFKLFHDKDTIRILEPVVDVLKDPFRILLMVVIVLVPVNWLVEAKKWHFLVAKFGSISLTRAFVATIAGTCFSLFTPNRVGEFVGRVLFVQPKHRSKAVFATIVGSISQFLVTIIMGSIGAIWFISLGLQIDGIQGLGLELVLSLSILLAFLCAVIYFHPGILRNLFSNIKWLKKWRQAILVLDRYDNRSLMVVLVLSFLRYAIFSTQFVLLLYLFDVNIGIWNVYSSVFLVYLISTILPTVIFSELGVRELVAFSVMSVFTPNVAGIVAASFVLWVINLMLPAAIGALFILISRIEMPRTKMTV